MDETAVTPTPAPARRLALPAWTPLAVAAAFMIIAVVQTWRTIVLFNQLRAAHAALQAVKMEISDQAAQQSLSEIHLNVLQPRGDPAYASAKVSVAWDSRLHEGIVATDGLPTPPAGKAYEIWVLDPAEPTPINGMLLKPEGGSQRFAVHALNTELPGFAVTLEPEGGSTTATGAVILGLAPPQVF